MTDSLHNQVIFQHILRRIGRNKNALILIVGDTGSGKSYAALRLCEKLAQYAPSSHWPPNMDLSFGFNVDYCVFDADVFLDLTGKQLAKGQPILFDEIGIAMGARNWQSKENKSLSQILQTFRYKGYIVVCTVPDMSFVDVHARKLFHYYCEAKSINYDSGISKITIKRNQIDRSTGDVYRKNIQFETEDGLNAFAGALRLKMPSKRLVDDYELKKDRWNADLNSKLKNKMDEVPQSKPQKSQFV